ncbi:MAG: hypothetical protein A2481_01560 [Candidatus Yonathbacteria bacterium RIFOXYC2_FULL_47_9]|nr:MAG: hypothetical protein A2481_01560 [Candidatus Yonathbacteria bacterium RIFOXYC2_FULL_47_9]HAT68433.1 hypothetical protein [Candidatus Yonathbacteria bacterium]
MNEPIILICTERTSTMLHREREILRRAESLGIVLISRAPDDVLPDTPHRRVNVGTIGHMKGALALAMAESLRFVCRPLPEIEIKAISYGKDTPIHQFAKIRKQHADDFQRKLKQLLRPTRNFCCRRR